MLLLVSFIIACFILGIQKSDLRALSIVFTPLWLRRMGLFYEPTCDKVFFWPQYSGRFLFVFIQFWCRLWHLRSRFSASQKRPNFLWTFRMYVCPLLKPTTTVPYKSAWVCIKSSSVASGVSSTVSTKNSVIFPWCFILAFRLSWLSLPSNHSITLWTVAKTPTMVRIELILAYHEF